MQDNIQFFISNSFFNNNHYILRIKFIINHEIRIVLKLYMICFILNYDEYLISLVQRSTPWHLHIGADYVMTAHRITSSCALTRLKFCACNEVSMSNYISCNCCRIYHQQLSYYNSNFHKLATLHHETPQKTARKRNLLYACSIQELPALHPE